jgi:phosphoribosylaminoimidazole-succinocarboxamide synthase
LTHIYEGKTKTVFRLENGNILLRFKDDATGTDGVFDPGANAVGLTIPGMGNAGLRMTDYFFGILHTNGIRTHCININIDKNEMEVLPAKFFGKGVEVICRFKARGSFIRRYGLYAEDGADLTAAGAPFVELTLKDDGRGDPPISRDALVLLGIMTAEEYDETVRLARLISGTVRDELSKRGLELQDIKLEFARNGGGIMLIDEISAGNLRVNRDGKTVGPLELTALLLG